MSDLIQYRKSTLHEELAKFDTLLHGVTVINDVVRMSHDGFLFHQSGKVLAIADDATAQFMMITGSIAPHIQRVRVDVERGNVDLTMYEDITTSDDGGQLPAALNVRRGSDHVATAKTYGSPTVTDTGLLFHTHWIPPTGTGVGSSSGVMDTDQGEEWILLPNTKYLFNITNKSGGTLDMRYEFVWYEIGYNDND